MLIAGFTGGYLLWFVALTCGFWFVAWSLIHEDWLYVAIASGVIGLCLVTGLVFVLERCVHAVREKCSGCGLDYVQQSEHRLSKPRYCRLDHQRKHPVRGPPWAGRDCGMFHGVFQVGSGIPEALNHILEGRISLGSCRSGAGPFLITATWPMASSASLAPAMRLCSRYYRGRPSSSGISRTGLDSSSGEFPNNPGWFDSGAIGQLGRVQLKQMPQIASCGEVIPGSGGFQAKPVIWAVRPRSSAAFGCAVFAPAACGGAPPIGCAPA